MFFGVNATSVLNSGFRALRKKHSDVCRAEKQKTSALGGTATVGISSKQFLQQFLLSFFRPPMINPREKTHFSAIFSRHSAGRKIMDSQMWQDAQHVPKTISRVKNQKTFGPFAEEPPRSSLAFFS